MSSTLNGSKYIPASPTTSGSDVALATATGVPQAIASRGGMPNPSKKDGYTKSFAAL